jgi:hypothetical protein
VRVNIFYFGAKDQVFRTNSSLREIVERYSGSITTEIGGNYDLRDLNTCVHYKVEGVKDERKFKEDALRITGVDEVCRECAKREKYKSIWFYRDRGEPTSYERFEMAAELQRSRPKESQRGLLHRRWFQKR